MLVEGETVVEIQLPVDHLYKGKEASVLKPVGKYDLGGMDRLNGDPALVLNLDDIRIQIHGLSLVCTG